MSRPHTFHYKGPRGGRPARAHEPGPKGTPRTWLESTSGKCQNLSSSSVAGAFNATTAIMLSGLMVTLALSGCSFGGPNSSYEGPTDSEAYGPEPSAGPTATTGEEPQSWRTCPKPFRRVPSDRKPPTRIAERAEIGRRVACAPGSPVWVTTSRVSSLRCPRRILNAVMCR